MNGQVRDRASVPQEPAWRSHVWKKGRETGKNSKKPRRKFHFKQIAR